MKTVFLNILKLNFLAQVGFCTMILPLEFVSEGIFLKAFVDFQIVALMISVTLAVANKDNGQLDKDDDSGDLD